MTTLDNGDKNFRQLINEIKTGQIKIPQFQRRFVWELWGAALFLDSIIKGYPIGTFIYWRTSEELRSVRNIGNLDLPISPLDERINYVLDGQQRITTFYAAIEGAIIEKADGKKEDYSQIYVDLEAKEGESIIITDITGKIDKTYIRLKDLIETDVEYLIKFERDRIEKINDYRKILEGFQFKGVNLKDADLDVATEVFTRLNIGGRALSLFEIMVAKMYDGAKQFDLSEKYEELIEELREVNYETIAPATILQIISMLLEKDVTRKQILKLKKDEFITIWPQAIDSLKLAIDFLKRYGVPVSRLLPYNALLVPFSYFFYNYKKTPSAETVRLLGDFFWRCSLGFRYSNGVENKLAQDVEKVDQILKGKLPKYEWSIDINTDTVKKVGYFSTGRSFIKAILCLYAMNKPKSFKSNLDVCIDNKWLKVSTSKNYHHFFPKAYMKKSHPEMDPARYNHILNITIVDDELNKKDIKANAPATYIAKFLSNNNKLQETLRTHLIGSLDEFGIPTNNYELFFSKRAELVSSELSSKLIDQRTGNEVQTESEEELEEETIEEN
jgi:hypothetical protein